MGLRPRMVPGSRENLKVTYPEDLAIAEAILRAR
ncbi:MAG: 2-C-methyl-D-erythritol 4-phosphate cytidylyltransferase [Terriglobales bacterium]